MLYHGILGCSPSLINYPGRRVRVNEWKDERERVRVGGRVTETRVKEGGGVEANDRCEEFWRIMREERQPEGGGKRRGKNKERIRAT